MEAGVTLEEIISVALSHGWFLPVTPGTQYPTIGGCFAADVHGKNHHNAGTISKHIHWFDLLCADGRIIRCSKSENSELFWATAGGMGLTGIILRLELQLTKVSSAYMYTKRIRVANLKEMMDTLTAVDTDWPYTVAWVDCMASGDSLGRGEIILGRHAEQEELPQTKRSNPYAIDIKPKITLPPIPVSLVNRLSGKLFNECIFLSHGSKKEKTAIESYATYFYPLDVVNKWNRLYGKYGLVQFQYVVPLDVGYAVTRQTLDYCVKKGYPSTLSVFKRFGEASRFLSFPKPGWTIALDFPARPGLFEILDYLDELVVDAGGREYLAKDSRMTRKIFEHMYPEWDAWKKVRNIYDPDRIFSSDLAKRLALVED